MEKKGKIIRVLIAMPIFVLVAIAMIMLQRPQILNISLVESDELDTFKMNFSMPVRSSKIEIKRLDRDAGIWIGENKQLIEDRDYGILEILIYDTNISEELREEISNTSVSKSASLDIVQLESGIEYITSYPPDDSVAAVYLLISNRIVDLSGMDLEEGNYLKSLEINVSKECEECWKEGYSLI